MIHRIIKKRYHNGIIPRLYFWRDNTGNEIDCLEEAIHKITIYEIKSSATFNKEYFKGLNYYLKISENNNLERILVYGGTESYTINEIAVNSWLKIN